MAHLLTIFFFFFSIILIILEHILIILNFPFLAAVQAFIHWYPWQPFNRQPMINQFACISGLQGRSIWCSSDQARYQAPLFGP